MGVAVGALTVPGTQCTLALRKASLLSPGASKMVQALGPGAARSHPLPLSGALPTCPAWLLSAALMLQPVPLLPIPSALHSPLREH